MNMLTRKSFLVATVAAVGLLCGGVVWADDVLIPKGTVITVSLVQDVSTATIKTGDKIKAVYVGDEEGGFPTGTVFVTTVEEATAKSGNSSGHIKVSNTVQVVLPSKKTVEIQAKPVNVNPSSGGSKEKKRTKGKGAAAGAAAGMAVAGNNVTGALLGGAAGAYAGKRKADKAQEIVIKKGATFGMELLAQARVPQ